MASSHQFAGDEAREAARTGVARHVDLRALLAGPPDEFDARNAALVDGRAVHHYLQFVEPIMVEQYPDAAYCSDCATFGASLLGGFSPWKHARNQAQTRIPPSLPREPTFHRIHGALDVEVVRQSGTVEAITAETPTAADVLGVASAIAQLAEQRMDFFVELAIGVAVVSDCYDASSVERLPQGWSMLSRAGGLVAAGDLLVCAAREFIWQWVSAEIYVSSPAPRTIRHDSRLRELVDVFASSVYYEWVRRLGRAAPVRPSLPTAAELAGRTPTMLKWLATFETTPLCQELVACWFPGWRRSLFIFNSPFDPMASLRQVTQPRGVERAAE